MASDKTVVFSKQQAASIEKLNIFLDQTEKNLYYLFGFAGTGKTFVISYFVKQILSDNKVDQIFICAPTHKALNVIESYFKSNITQSDYNIIFPKISFMTIHKLFEFQPIISAKDGVKGFKSNRESRFLKQMNRKLVIIDECSMISKDMDMEIKKHIELYQFKCMYLGDEMQLPPVGETNSVVFSNLHPTYKYHTVLNEIMRTKSSDIKKVSALIREWNLNDPLDQTLLKVRTDPASEKKFKLFRQKPDIENTVWFKKLVEKIESGDLPIILTWKNSVAANYNNIIRKYIHKTAKIANYMVGDHLMFNNFYMNPDGAKFYTSDMVKIIEIVSEKRELNPWMAHYIPYAKTNSSKIFNKLLSKLSKLPAEIVVDTFVVKKIYSEISVIDNNTYKISVVNMKSLEVYDTLIKGIENHITYFFTETKNDTLTSDLWDIFYKELKDPFAEISFGYSTTVYKSQGSTFNTVIIDTVDVYENKTPVEVQKSLYTAATRASDELWFLV